MHLALEVALEAVVGELAHHGLDAGAAELHLVERLDGGEPRDGARAALAARQRAASGLLRPRR